MAFKDVPNQVDFVALEQEILKFWRETDAFNALRRLRATSDKRWSFLDGPITANNPMGCITPGDAPTKTSIHVFPPCRATISAGKTASTARAWGLRANPSTGRAARAWA